MKLIYNIGIQLFTLLVRLVSPFNEKARLWIRGRKNWYPRLLENVKIDERNIWIHCASLGEFEQGRPVIEMIKKEMPGSRIILTFFSPSGYEIRKNYSEADYVCYLPADTPRNAKRFIDTVNPDIVIFVKYEFWNNYLTGLSRRGIPVYLISGLFRPGQHFFRWYGSFFRTILHRFSHIFVQDEVSKALLEKISVTNVSVAGDTRFDRVVQISGNARDIPQIALFRGDEKLFLAGSSWKPDEDIIAQYINTNPGRMKWIFAPHEIDSSNIDRIEKLFSVDVVRFSDFSEERADARVMIIDNIGMLSSAFSYAYIAAIGGGFGKGIHNVLEPACWSIPVVFGPNFTKFREAVDLIKLNCARSYSSYDEFEIILDKWLTDEAFYLNSSKKAGGYVIKNTGATAVIMSKLTHKDINIDRS